MNAANDILPSVCHFISHYAAPDEIYSFLLTLAKGRHVSRGRDEEDEDEDKDEDDMTRKTKKKRENRISCIRQV